MKHLFIESFFHSFILSFPHLDSPFFLSFTRVFNRPLLFTKYGVHFHFSLSGCIPQAAPKLSYIQGLSVIGVQQIDRVTEVVEETLKGE